MSKIRINRRKDYREQLKLYLNLSKSLNAKTKKLLRKTARIAEREFIEFGDMYYVFLEDFSNDLYKILSTHYRSVITTTSERLIKQRETKQEEEIDIIVATYIAEVTANKVADISQTTRKQLRQAIKKGIARTETHSAMNYANHEISGKLGLNRPVKEWNSALDDRTRAWHRGMNGTTVSRDDMFKVMTPIAGGGFVEKRMNYTGDINGGALNVINCRCFTLYYDSEDEII